MEKYKVEKLIEIFGKKNKDETMSSYLLKNNFEKIMKYDFLKDENFNYYCYTNYYGAFYYKIKKDNFKILNYKINNCLNNNINKKINKI